MFGHMMQTPLLISSLIDTPTVYHGDTEIVSRPVEGRIHRYTYRDAHRRDRANSRTRWPRWAWRRRPRRHAGLERLPPLRALLRRVRHGRGDPHHQPAAVSRADRLHRQPRRETRSCSST